MKYLKITLGILLALIIIFLAIGMIKPTVSYDYEILINKPFAEAWEVSQDSSKLKDWLTGFKRIERVSGTPGTVGSVSDVYFDNAGQEMAIRETITEIVPNESISMLYESDLMDMDYKLIMIPEGSQTRLSSQTLVRGNGMIFKSIMALSKSSFLEQEELNMSLLKKTIEENTTDYFSTQVDSIDSRE